MLGVVWHCQERSGVVSFDAHTDALTDTYTDTHTEVHTLATVPRLLRLPMPPRACPLGENGTHLHVTRS